VHHGHIVALVQVVDAEQREQLLRDLPLVLDALDLLLDFVQVLVILLSHPLESLRKQGLLELL
jgi:hypothetical protein